MPIKYIISFFLLLLFASSCEYHSEISHKKLYGQWINQSNDYLEITDTTTNNNFIGNDASPIGKYLRITGDTLSFQDRYSSSEDNYSTNRINKADFKIILLTDTLLSIVPISTSASKIFEKDTINFTRQQYAIDHSIHFEKITFHTTHCFGHCPIYHLEIEKNGKAQLHKEKIYKKSGRSKYSIDSLNMGYYSGKITNQTLDELNHHIKTCNLEKLVFNGGLCCDGPIITIIIAYNGKKKYLKSMFPPRLASNLINHLYFICDHSDLHRSDAKFELEK